MWWDGKYFEGKSIIITLWKSIREEWLEKEHQRSDWWRTLDMNKQWTRIIRPSEDTVTVQ